MGLRPGRCYKWDSPAYTRVAKNPQDSFITGIPGSKVTKYNMGNLTEKFDTEVSLVTENRMQIRHNALEASRIATNNILEERLGRNAYRFKIRIYPHHVMRENVMATGAGADRVQSGMRGAFGKPVGRAARLNKNQIVMSVYVNHGEKRIKNAKTALRVAMSKLPKKMRILVKPVNEG